MEILQQLNDVVNKYKPSKCSFRELFNSTPSYKDYRFIKTIFLNELTSFYNQVDLNVETVDNVKMSISYKELRNQYILNKDWYTLSLKYKINFIDYYNINLYLNSKEYNEFEAYLDEFSIVDKDKISLELDSLD